MRRRSALALAYIALLALCAAAPASADSCVGPSMPCFATIQLALNDAALTPGTDTITVAPGTYAAASAAALNPVRVVGSGPTQTTVTSNVAAGYGLELQAPGSGIASLHVRVTANGARGVRFAGSAGDVLVDAPAGLSSVIGAVLTGDAALDASTILLPFAPGPANNEAVRVQDAGTKTVTGLTATGDGGVNASAGSLVLRSSRIGAQRAVDLVGVPATLDDVLIAISPADSGEAGGVSMADSPVEATLRNVTVWGPGASTPGAGLVTDDTGQAHLVSSVVRNFATDLRREPDGGTLDTRNSAYGPTTGTVTDLGGNLAGTGAPGFIDAAAGDFRLAWFSPLVDAGLPGAPGDPPTDLAGLARVANGRVDIGAFEYQRRPPSPSLAVQQGEFKAGDPIGFDASGSTDADPGDAPLAFSWTFDDGGAAAGVSVAHAFETAGNHVATLTVTDPAGASATTSRVVVVDAKGGGGLLPAVPTLSGFSATSAKLKRGRGTSFRYALSAAAKSVKVSFEQLVAGKRSGRSCVKPTRKLARAKACTRAVAKGGIAGPAAAGRNSLAWDGRIKRKALAEGRYRATARGTDRFGRLTNTRTLAFSVVASR